MAHRSQRSSLEDNPFAPNYLPPHYREEYRLAIDALVEHDLEGYYNFLQRAGIVDFLSQMEVDHIRNTVQAPRQISQPELPYLESEPDGSSDTYWPVHSDLEAPCLDLGWPMNQGFIGPTEVTTLVNPSDPEMPSIKEQARRLIRTARQVIAVAMDMFTDVDIFADLLDAAARRVAVYVLLDEQNAHYFSSMVTNCRVNLEMVQSMRVRTVSGTTYYCRTGKSFKGQMMDRFLMVDCKAVLSGNYSFMWTFEKIHRCIAHLFLGELVITFDEEFRILYAQSEPLVIENSLVPVPVPVPAKSSYGIRQFLNPNPMQVRNPREFLHIVSPHVSEMLGCPMEDRMDLERNMPLLRRNDPFRGFQDPETLQVYSNKYSTQQLRMERSFLGYDRSIMASRQMEMNTYKRHCYAEGNQESYSSSRQIMKHRVKYNPEDVESLNSYHREQHYHQGGGSGSGHAMYNKLQAHEHPCADKYSEQYEYQPELEPPGSYNRVLDYVSSDSSREIRHSYEPKPTLEGHCGRSSTRRPSLGQPYPCQSSPIQSHPPDHKQLFIKSNPDHQPRDPSVKQGLRKWRISSYLSALENATDEGMPEPLGPDAFDDPIQQSEEELYGLEAEHSKFSGIDHPQIPTIKPNLLPRFGKPVLKVSENQPYLGAESQKTAETAEPHSDSGSVSITGRDKAEEVELRKPREISRHESFRNRANLSVLRSSRLRSSLIFSSSQLEQHFSTEMKSAAELKQSENPVEEKEMDPLKTSTVVAEIVGKRRFITREPYNWSLHKQRIGQNAPSTSITKTEECTNVSGEKMNLYKASSESSLKLMEVPDSTKVSENKEIPKGPGQDCQANVAPQEKSEMIMAGETLKPLHELTSFINMNDPEARFKYFKELAAKRKALNTENKCDAKNPGPPVRNTDLSQTLTNNSSTTHVESDTTSVLKEHKIPMDSTNEHTKEQHKIMLKEPATKMTAESHKASESTTSFINMNDPEARFKYFKELAAKRKASNTENKCDAKNPGPPVRNTDLSQTLTNNSSTTHVESGTTSVLKERKIPMDSTNEHTKEQHKIVLKEPATKMTAESHKASESTTSFINMNDPEARFRYFKELAAKRKASNTENKFEPKNPGLPVRNTDLSQTLTNNSSTTHVESGTTSVLKEHKIQMDSTNEYTKEQHKIVLEEQTKMTEGSLKAPESSSVINMNDPETRFLYFKELAAKQKASRITSESVPKPPLKTTEPSEASAHSSCIKPEMSVAGSKPTVSTFEVSQSHAVVPPVPEPLAHDHLKQDMKNASRQGLNHIAEVVKKEPAVKQEPDILDEQDTLRPFMLASTATSILSCNEELLRDATDAQKTQLMKSRHHNATSIFFCESTKALHKSQGSGSSPDTLHLTGDGKQDIEVHDHLDSQVQKVKGREGDTKAVTEDVLTLTVITGTEESEQLASEAEHVSKPESNVDVTGTAQSKGEDGNQSPHVLSSSKNSQSRYQAATTNILYSSNLRDDTKVILERISANSQNRMELAKQAAPITDDAKEGDNAHSADKTSESVAAGQDTSHFQRTSANPQDREVLLKRIESMRKEKKVYSRFEVLCINEKLVSL